MTTAVPTCGFRWREAPRPHEGYADVWRTCVLHAGHTVAHEPDPDAPGEPVAVKVEARGIGVGDTVKISGRATPYLVVEVEHALRLSRDRRPSTSLRRLTLLPVGGVGRAVTRTFDADMEITRVRAAFEVVAEGLATPAST